MAGLGGLRTLAGRIRSGDKVVPIVSLPPVADFQSLAREIHPHLRRHVLDSLARQIYQRLLTVPVKANGDL